MNAKVCAIVVTYNKLDMLKRCIISIEEQEYSVNDILVVDNNSTDGTKEYLDGLKNVTTLHLDQNVGGAGGFEVGIRYFYEHTESNYCWIMDDDTFPDNDSLEELMKVDKLLDGHFGFLSSFVYWKDGTPCVMNRPKLASDWNEKLTDNILKIESASFVSMLTSRNMVKKVGLPIGEFFIWGDDVEYSRRLSNLAPSYLVSQSKTLHFMGSNTGVDITEDDHMRVPRYFYSFRNRFFNAKKNSPKKVIHELMRNIYLTFKILVKSKDHRFLRIKQIYKGQFAGFKFNPAIKKV